MKVEFSHLLEDTTGLFFMGFWVRRGNEEVIHIDDKLSFSDHILEGVDHESLEHGGGVAEIKEHDSGFEESFVGDEGSFPLVAVLYLNIVIPPVNIELGKGVSFSFSMRSEMRGRG